MIDPRSAKKRGGASTDMVPSKQKAPRTDVRNSQGNGPSFDNNRMMYDLSPVRGGNPLPNLGAGNNRMMANP